MKTRRIRAGEKVPVTLTARERLLVIDHTFADGELTEPLEAARQRRGKCVVRYTLDDIDELVGHVAAEANHSKNKKFQKELDALYARLREEMHRYDDGQWQEPSVTVGSAKKQPAGTGRAILSLVKGSERGRRTNRCS